MLNRLFTVLRSKIKTALRRFESFIAALRAAVLAGAITAARNVRG
jgi:hypothetical protein